MAKARTATKSRVVQLEVEIRWPLRTETRIVEIQGRTGDPGPWQPYFIIDGEEYIWPLGSHGWVTYRPAQSRVAYVSLRARALAPTLERLAG